MKGHWHTVGADAILRHNERQFPVTCGIQMRCGNAMQSAIGDVDRTMEFRVMNNRPARTVVFIVSSITDIVLRLKERPLPTMVHGVVLVNERPWFAFEKELVFPKREWPFDPILRLGLQREVVATFSEDMSKK